SVNKSQTVITSEFGQAFQLSAGDDQAPQNYESGGPVSGSYRSFDIRLRSRRASVAGHAWRGGRWPWFRTLRPGPNWRQRGADATRIDAAAGLRRSLHADEWW